jgi:hypothetical protein
MTNMQTSLPLLIVRLSILNPVINFSTHLWLVKWNALWLYLCLAHSIPSPPMLMQHMHQPITNDMIHFISSYDHIGSSILTSLALHCCFGPLAPSHHSTCPSHLQPVHQAKPCLDLLHLSHLTRCHISYAMSSFITCVSLATYPSHFHLHSMCFSHKCSCGLITCVFHLNTLVHLGCYSITKTKQETFKHFGCKYLEYM